MKSVFGRNGRRTSIGGLFVAVMMALALAPAGVARAGGGGATFEWCPSPLPHADPGCAVGISIQDVVTRAQTAHVPGTVYINAGTFTENVVATGLKDVRIQGNANSSTGTTVNGSLAISKSKNIAVVDFTFTSGISVDKGSGAYWLVGNTGVLEVTNSKFDKNTAGSGLYIVNYSNVSLSKVSASKSRDYGILVSTSGSIVATDITASQNGIGGAYLFANSTILVNATRSRGNRFDRNGITGLFASTGGTIVVTDTSASRNSQYGLFVNGGGLVLVNTELAKMNKFDRNGYQGVNITATAAIVLLDVSASSNADNGLTLDSDSTISIQGNRSKMLRFDKNTGHGVEANSDGTITLTDTSASRNGGDGVHLGSGGGIRVQTYLSKLGRFDKNGGYGIVATTSGYVNLFDVSASRNVSGGAFVGAGSNTNLAAPNSKLNRFDKNLGHGLMVSGSGPIAMADISASGNQVDGAHLSSPSTIYLVTSLAKTNKFDKNTGSGIFLSAGSTVLIQNTSATRNKANGLDLTTSDDQASVTCSAVKSNLIHDIRASLGSANLILNSVTLTHPGLVDVNFLGIGTVNVSTVSCP